MTSKQHGFPSQPDVSRQPWSGAVLRNSVDGSTPATVAVRKIKGMKPKKAPKKP